MKSRRGKNQDGSALWPRHSRNAAETRERILVAAKTLFSKNGYSNVGTRDIAAAAGVNLTLINRYFGSKKKLFTEVVMSLVGSAGSPIPAKDKTVQAVMEFLSDEPSPRKERLRLVLLSALDPDVSDVISDFLVERHKTLAQFIHGDNRETKAALIISSIIGIALTSSLIFDKNAPYVSDKDYIRKYFTGAFEALFGEETDKRHGQDQER